MDKLNVGDKLTAGQNLTSPNGKYTLTMQPDGNLVMYDAGKRSPARRGRLPARTSTPAASSAVM